MIRRHRAQNGRRSTSRTSSSAGRPRTATRSRTRSQTCSPFLAAQILAIRPRVIVTLGAPATKTAAAHQGRHHEAARGQWHEYQRHPGDAHVPPGLPAAGLHPREPAQGLGGSQGRPRSPERSESPASGPGRLTPRSPFRSRFAACSPTRSRPRCGPEHSARLEGARALRPPHGRRHGGRVAGRAALRGSRDPFKADRRRSGRRRAAPAGRSSS